MSAHTRIKLRLVKSLACYANKATDDKIFNDVLYNVLDDLENMFLKGTSL